MIREPQPGSDAERRHHALTARADLYRYRDRCRDKDAASPSLDRLKDLLQARRKIDRLITLEGYAPMDLQEVVDREERDRAQQQAPP